MHFNVISNLTNGAGLEREYNLLRHFLEMYGHRVAGVQWTDTECPRADVNLFDEVVAPQFLNSAKENWLMPHPEWYHAPAWDPYVLKQFSKILCKTHDCFNIWRKRMSNAEVIYTGFEANDQYLTVEGPREYAFLHIPGGSRTRQSKEVADAWRNYKLPFKLTVLSRCPDVAAYFDGIPSVTVHTRLADAELRLLLNKTWFVIAPSKYEGYGHLIHEALSTGAAILTTDAPPMNEFTGVDSALRIEVIRKEPWCLATANFVSAQTVRDAVVHAAGLDDDRLERIRQKAVLGYLYERDEFRSNWRKLMEAYK